DQADTRFDDLVRYALVLTGNPLFGINQEQGDVRLGQGLPGAQDRIEVGILADLGLTPDAGRVHQYIGTIVDLDLDVDRVPGGTRSFGDDHPLLPHQAIQQGGLADVG